MNRDNSTNSVTHDFDLHAKMCASICSLGSVMALAVSRRLLQSYAAFRTLFVAPCLSGN
jgi:hypothetical protein